MPNNEDDDESHADYMKKRDEKKNRQAPYPRPSHAGEARNYRQHVSAIAREYTELAIETLVAVCQDENCHPGARVNAAGTLLDRGWGKAPQTINVEGELKLEEFSDAKLNQTLRNEIAAFLVSGSEGTDQEEYQGQLN